MISDTDKLIIKAALRARCDFRDTYHKGQKAIEQTLKASGKKLHVFNIARQFGKTYFLVAYSLQQAASKPNQVIKIATAFQTDLVSFILPVFKQFMTDIPPDRQPKYNTSRCDYSFDNGSIIQLVGMDKNPNKLRGNVIDILIVDEAAFLKVGVLDYIYKSVAIPATLHRPNAKIIFSSSAPESLMHDFVSYIHKAKAENCYNEFTIYDNPRLTQKQIEETAQELGGYESVAFKRECMCELISDDTKLVVPEFSEDLIQDTSSPEYNNEYKRYYLRYTAADIGLIDLTAGLFSYYDFRKAAIIIEDELTISGKELTTEKIAEAFKTKELLHYGPLLMQSNQVRRICDNSDLLLINDLSASHNMRFGATSKDSLEAMVNEVRLWIKHKRVIINPRCKLLIDSLRYGMWQYNKAGTKREFERNSELGHLDLLATLVYLIRNIDVHTNPVPVMHNLSPHTHHLGKGMDINKNELANAFSKKRR